MQAVRQPTANKVEGLADIDWEINLVTASRHKPKVKQQSATLVLQPSTGGHKQRIMFEASKANVTQMLDKLAVVDQFIEAA